MFEIINSSSEPSFCPKSLNTLYFMPSYLRNTPIDVYNKTAKDPIFLPSQWNPDDSSNYIEVTENGLGLRYIGTAYVGIDYGEFYPMVGLITTNESIEANFGGKPFKYDISFHAKIVFDHAIENDLRIEQEPPVDYSIDDIMPPQFYCDNCGAYY
ncbi:16155_t:CDS:2 [Acaulospora colombiana]|uniref:16155_t:CDS:1 n=1 Tax=Acaulospora colombiana TaxID=27376 RepID=A0ACA9K6A0_9GLOM|nr:16155_t:CDS:2 [Acaulospora colombiana]